MEEPRDSTARCAEDPLALRQQIDQLQEHIDLLMIEYTVIQERRCLLQQRQDMTSPAAEEKEQQSDTPCDESVHADSLSMKESYSDSVSGVSFALEGAQGFSGSGPYLESSATVFSDHSVVMQTPPQSRGTAKLRAKLREMRAAHRRLQSAPVSYEPAALFQGLMEYL